MMANNGLLKDGLIRSKLNDMVMDTRGYLRQNMSRYGNEEASSTNVIMYHEKKGGIPNQHWEFVPKVEMETEISSLK